MALNRASDAPAADLLSQTHVTNYRDFSRVVIRFFSVVEIPRTPVSIIEYYYYYYYDSIYLWMPYKKQAKPGAASVTQGP